MTFKSLRVGQWFTFDHGGDTMIQRALYSGPFCKFGPRSYVSVDWPNEPNRIGSVRLAVDPCDSPDGLTRDADSANQT